MLKFEMSIFPSNKKLKQTIERREITQIFNILTFFYWKNIRFLILQTLIYYNFLFEHRTNTNDLQSNSMNAESSYHDNLGTPTK